MVSGVYHSRWTRTAFAEQRRPRDRLVIGGWEYNFIGMIQSGTPLNHPGNFNLIGDPIIERRQLRPPSSIPANCF